MDFYYLATDQASHEASTRQAPHRQTQTAISADPAEIMVQACGRLKSLQISTDFETTSFEVFAYLPNLPTTLKLRRDKLRQAQISIFHEAMTFFIRLCQPNKTFVSVRVGLPGRSLVRSLVCG